MQTYRKLASQGKIAKGKIALKHDGSRPVGLSHALIVLLSLPAESMKVPADPSSASDREVVERVADIYIGVLSQPIYGRGRFSISTNSII